MKKWQAILLLILAGISTYANFSAGQYIFGIIVDVIIAVIAALSSRQRRREIAARKALKELGRKS